MLSFSDVRPWTLEPLCPDAPVLPAEVLPVEEPGPDPEAVRDALAAAWEEGFQSGYRDGLHAAREILKQRPGTRILILSMYSDEQYVRNAYFPESSPALIEVSD